MNNFKYEVPTRIHFGKGQIVNLSRELQPFQSILLLFGSGSIKNNGVYDRVISILRESGKQYCELGGVVPNPRISKVREGVSLCRRHHVDLVLAVGAGSVIDSAKVIAAGNFYAGDPWDFFSGKARINKVLPIGTILTLTATGSEMNGNTVISNELTGQKLATGHPRMYPMFSILDPEFTYSLPAWQTAAGVADIMSHVFEQYFSNVKGTFVQDRLAEAILKTCVKYGPIAVEQPENFEARANLMWAGSIALNGLLGAGKISDWATHQIEHELSALNDLTHGAGLAILTPNWMTYVLNESTLGKFVSYGREVWDLCGNEFEIAEMSISKTRELFNSLGLPSKLTDVGIFEKSFEEIAHKAVQTGYIPGELGNFKILLEEDVLRILRLSA
ncbi:MAG: iron-containing alcohol dehydrogenase [Bacteroidetes bacterium]|nr:iron-containing alcohol dehydrogenase [Bacteroidota bacterium]MBU1718251.1 iron-containing alcohol dehydrogenase [Bacteroidota bacterium]